MRRTIVIGDVHGCAEEFEALLLTLKIRSKDRVFQVGDLINRGPDSRYTIKLAKKHSVQSTLGNHEVRLLRAREQNNTDALKSYDQETFDQLTKSDWRFLKRMSPYIYLKKRKTVIVHAGFLPKPAWHKQAIDTITQIRSIDTSNYTMKPNTDSDTDLWAEHWHGKPFVVYGHNARPEVFKRPGSIGIDTGCVYGGHLTAYILEDKSIVQIPALNKYA